MDSQETAFACKLLLKNAKYLLLNNGVYYFFRKRNEIHEWLMQNNEFYTNNIDFFLKELIDYSIEKTNKLEDFIKYVVLENLIRLLENTPVAEVLSQGELEDFYKKMKYILDFMKSDEIVEICNNISHSSFLICVKNDTFTLENILNSKTNSLKIESSNNNVQVFSGDYIIDDLSSRPIFRIFH